MIIGSKYINLKKRYQVDEIRERVISEDKKKYSFGFKSLDGYLMTLFEFDSEEDAHRNRQKLIRRLEKDY